MIIGKIPELITGKKESIWRNDALYFGDVDGFKYISDKYGPDEVQRLKTGRGSNLKLTVTYYPKINEYKGYKSIQLIIQNYR